jgi:hypothetical protein
MFKLPFYTLPVSYLLGTMTPLPPALPSTLAHLTTTVTDAYSTIQQLEKSATLHEIQYPQLVIHARVLGYLILEGPSDQAREVVANEIVSCENQEKVAELGKFYCDHFICFVGFSSSLALCSSDTFNSQKVQRYNPVPSPL